jgi:D-glycero-D-manno-heptose 1,7-bisphosphate phosphatase
MTSRSLREVHELLTLELVLLDRDGVLNRNLDRGVLHEDDWVWVAGARTAVRMLADRGLRLMVVTNQGNIGRGLLTVSGLAAIHRRMLRELRPAPLGIADVLYCPHRPDEGCDCRKPKPGLIHKALENSGVSPRRAILIGDHESDIMAAEAAGCMSLHVQTGRGGPPGGAPPGYLGTVADLFTAANLLVAPRR